MHWSAQDNEPVVAGHRFRHPVAIVGKQRDELGAALNRTLTHQPDRRYGTMLQDQQPHRLIRQQEATDFVDKVKTPALQANLTATPGSASNAWSPPPQERQLMDRTATNSRGRAREVPGADLPKIAYGKGVRLFDVQGKDYIDGSGGPAVYCLGHAHLEVNEAIKQQLDRVAHGYRYNFTLDPLEELTEIVANRCGSGYERMIFTTGGSEAVESALKVALHFHRANGEPSRRRFISRRRSWH